VTQKSLVCLPETLLIGTGSETAHIEVGEKIEHKTQAPFGSVSLDADPSVVRTEQLAYVQSVKAEKVAETTDIGSTLGAATLHLPPVLHTEQLSYEQSVKVEKVSEAADIGCTLGAGILHRPPVLQESREVASKFSDELGGEGYIDSHEHLKHGGLNSNMDQGQEQDLESDPEHYFGSDQDQDLESDQDFESERPFPYIESGYDGERRSYEQCPAHNMKVLGYGSVFCSVVIKIEYSTWSLLPVLNRVCRGFEKL